MFVCPCYIVSVSFGKSFHSEYEVEYPDVKTAPERQPCAPCRIDVTVQLHSGLTHLFK